MMQVVEMEKARITIVSDRVRNVRLEQSMTVGAETTAGSTNSPEIQYYIVANAVVDGARYPSLAAVWENDDDDAAFANL